MFRRKPRPEPPPAPPVEYRYFRGITGGEITTSDGTYVGYAHADRWLRVEWPRGALVGPLDGPHTLDEANAIELTRQQEEWDHYRRQRKDHWDSADYRARTILGSWANVVHADAIAELRKLIFQAQYGFSNESPDMPIPRPTAEDVRLTFRGD